MKRSLILLCLISLVFSCSFKEKMFHKFQKFVKKYNKNYSSISEFLARFNVFVSNYIEAKKTNKESHHSGITQFSDLTKQEFAKTYLNLDFNALSIIRPQASQFVNLNGAPDKWDWREHNAVSQVMDQGTCSGAWAFTTIGNLEGLYSIHKNELIPLSVQHLIDCDDNDSGCNGGMMDRAIEWITEHGLMRAEDYKYTGRVGQCMDDPTKYIDMKVVGLEKLGPEGTWSPCDENEMKEYLYQHGPLMAGLNASPLQTYMGGIIDLDAKRCDPYQINHAAVVVGYGTEGGIDFWTVKNSWGDVWGEKGYFKIARGKGTCGINYYVLSGKVEF